MTSSHTHETHLDHTLESIDQTVMQLQSAFKTYQSKMDEKMNHYQAALHHHPVAGALSTQHDEAFVQFMKKGLSTKGLSSTDHGGGVFVPHPLVESIHQHLTYQGSLRSLARVSEISTDTYDIVRENTQAQTGWTQETAQRDETTPPDLQKITIQTHELYARPKISQKLLDDSCLDLEEWISQKIYESMMRLENEAFLKGDGHHKPKGILPYVHDATIDSLKTKKDYITGETLIDLVTALPSSDHACAAWVVSRDFFATIQKLKDPTTGRFLLQPTLHDRGPSTILGYPVFINEAMDKIGDQSVPALFGNFKNAYHIIDRKEISILRDPFSSKPFVEFYATKRVGGDVVQPNALKALLLHA